MPSARRAEAMRLSKSQHIRGLQCHKALWLYRHRRDLIPATPPSLQLIFDQGHRIGELAWQRFPGGMLIKDDHLHIPEAIAATMAAAPSAPILYEAAAIHDRVLVRPDILIRKGGAWDMVEVKGSTRVKDVNLDDVAIQRYVLAGAGLPVRRCYVMHVNNKYVRRGGIIEVRKLFTLADVTKETADLQKAIPGRVAAMRKALALKAAPKIDIGPHCSDPYECEFIPHCWRHIPDYSVFNLVRVRHQKVMALMDRGILRVRDIPDEFPLTASQKLQVAVEKSDKPHIDRKAVAEMLREPKYPLHFLDFETIAPAIPPYDGLRPFQQTPFQASLHVQKARDGAVEHHEFLGDAKNDPRSPLADFLTRHIGPKGSVIAYSASFEGSCLAGLAEACPGRRRALLGIKERLWDLATPFRSAAYVHPKFQGRYSIKAVLPALIPGMTYDGMAIGNGGEASIAYLNLMEGMLPPAEARKTIQALKEYCGQDTLAMVRLFEVLCREAA